MYRRGRPLQCHCGSPAAPELECNRTKSPTRKRRKEPLRMVSKKRGALIAPDASVEDVFVAPSELHFDLKNPTFVGDEFQDEEQIIERLLNVSDVNELVQSILSAGFVDFEPLIV